MVATSKDATMQDLQTAEFVEVKVDETGKLWVNVDNICVLRIGKVSVLEVETSRHVSPIRRKF